LNEPPQDLPLPLYYRLSSMLKKRILEGGWPVGAKLPTETQLADQYEVSRQTVRRAKATLEEEGLITTIQGSGSRVADNIEWRLKKEPLSKIEDIVQRGQDTSFDLQEFHMVANTPRIAEYLQNPQDRFIFKICGVRYWMKQPLSYAVYHLPCSFGSLIQVDRLTDKPFIPQFEEMLGIKIIEGMQSIYPSRAGRQAAEKLNIRQGALVLSVDTIYLNEGYIPVYYINSIYHPGYRHEIKIKRADTA
jgi:DNA-binding GntR family transcriptional regulator